ncbi:hypothetical protein BH10PSE14_BH10PSE14_12960 [soil metagenome]
MTRATALLKSVVALLLLGAAVPAQADCATPPAIARSWLAHHPGWRIVTLADLNPDDRTWWRREKRGICPGQATARMDGSPLPYTAIALVSEKDSRDERVLLFHRAGHAPKQLVSVHQSNLAIVLRLPPGRYHGFEGGVVHSAHDAISVEFLETSSQLFYIDAGRVRNIWTSD